MTTKDTTIEKEVKTEKVAKVARPSVAKAVVGRYIEAVGRRQTSTARVRLTQGSKKTFFFCCCIFGRHIIL